MCVPSNKLFHESRLADLNSLRKFLFDCEPENIFLNENGTQVDELLLVEGSKFSRESKSGGLCTWQWSLISESQPISSRRHGWWKNYLIYLFLHEEHKMPRQHTLRPMSRYFFVRVIRCGLHGARFNDHGSSCDLGDMQDGASLLQCLDPNFSGDECWWKREMFMNVSHDMST